MPGERNSVSAGGSPPRDYELVLIFCCWLHERWYKPFLNGAAEVSIMRQTRHKSLNTLRKYIRDRSLFRDNPAAKLGL